MVAANALINAKEMELKGFIAVQGNIHEKQILSPDAVDLGKSVEGEK